MARKTKAPDNPTERLRDRPTPFWISKRTRNVLIVSIVVAVGFVMWVVPAAPIALIGGFGLALVLSFPVRALSHIMRRGLAIFFSFMLLGGLILVTVLILIPLIIQQFLALAQALPGLISEIQKYGLSGLRLLDEAGYLPRSPQETISSLREDLTNAARVIGSNTLGGLVGYLSGTFSFALSLFGILFVAAYLLADVRTLKASYLLAIPVSYRRDALVLWDAVGYSLSRYLSGLALILTIQGVLSAVALYLLGVPYSLVLGAWVSATAIIPLLGAWLGAIPGVIVAFTVSPLTGFLTILLFLVIQQLEGNFLTPRIQGQVLRVHPILIFLAVIVGGGLGVSWAYSSPFRPSRFSRCCSTFCASGYAPIRRMNVLTFHKLPWAQVWVGYRTKRRCRRWIPADTGTRAQPSSSSPCFRSGFGLRQGP